MFQLSHQQLILLLLEQICQVLRYTGPATYTWTEFTSSGPGTVDTSANPSFAINIGDTSLVLLELTIIDNNGSSWMCLYPTIIFWDGGSWIALRTSMPGTTGIDNFGQTVTPSFFKNC